MKGEVKPEYTQHITDMAARDVEAQVRKQGIRKPEEYKIAPPADYKAPDGYQFEPDETDPIWAHARTEAHKLGLDQEGFSKLIGVFAAAKVNELVATNTARTAELAKLGAAAPARIEAVETWLKAKVGGKAGPMMAALKAYPVAETVEALEGVIRAFSSQGGTDFTQSGRETAPEAGKIPGYDNMSFEQRRAAQMNQKFNAAGGR